MVLIIMVVGYIKRIITVISKYFRLELKDFICFKKSVKDAYNITRKL